ncbi:MAG TPA: hypothetical protein VFJ14_04735 [Nocardioidaceae bacterium]|nr:hypothetical protein [Nocardioidaceae bacterium]
MRLPVPGPRDLLSVLERGADSVEQLLSAAPRLVGLLADAEQLLARVDRLVDRLTALVDATEPALVSLQPTLERLAETTDPREVDSLVGLVDLLPSLAHKMEVDVVPVLDSLSTVAPDVHDLLDVTRELNEMLGAVPGLGRVKKRIDEEQLAEGRG